jgi:hypothetical protein
MPARQNTSTLSPIKAQVSTKINAKSSTANSGSAITWRGTPSMAAIAKMKTAITLSPSIGSFWRSIQSWPATRRIA